MPLGMEVGLGPGHIVLHGDPASPTLQGKGHSSLPPLFGLRCLLWPNGRPCQLLLSSCMYCMRETAYSAERIANQDLPNFSQLL